MSMPRAAALILVLAVGTALSHERSLQGQSAPVAKSYRLVENWPQLPAEIQTKLAICREGDCNSQINSILPGDAGSVWLLTRFDPPIIKVDSAGKLLKAFGDGM